MVIIFDLIFRNFAGNAKSFAYIIIIEIKIIPDAGWNFVPGILWRLAALSLLFGVKLASFFWFASSFNGNVTPLSMLSFISGMFNFCEPIGLAKLPDKIQIAFESTAKKNFNFILVFTGVYQIPCQVNQMKVWFHFITIARQTGYTALFSKICRSFISGAHCWWVLNWNCKYKTNNDANFVWKCHGFFKSELFFSAVFVVFRAHPLLLIAFRLLSALAF